MFEPEVQVFISVPHFQKAQSAALTSGPGKNKAKITNPKQTNKKYRLMNS
jgi:hypothetical protein